MSPVSVKTMVLPPATMSASVIDAVIVPVTAAEADTKSAAAKSSIFVVLPSCHS